MPVVDDRLTPAYSPCEIRLYAGAEGLFEESVPIMLKAESQDEATILVVAEPWDGNTA